MIDIECRRRWINFQRPKLKMERRRQQSEMSWAINQRVSANDWCSRLGFSRIAAADEDAKCHSARTQHSLRSSARVTKQNWPRPPPSSRMETIIMARQEEIPTANLHKNIIRPWNKKRRVPSRLESVSSPSPIRGEREAVRDFPIVYLSGDKTVKMISPINWLSCTPTLPRPPFPH